MESNRIGSSKWIWDKLHFPSIGQFNWTISATVGRKSLITKLKKLDSKEGQHYIVEYKRGGSEVLATKSAK